MFIYSEKNGHRFPPLQNAIFYANNDYLYSVLVKFNSHLRGNTSFEIDFRA